MKMLKMNGGEMSFYIETGLELSTCHSNSGMPHVSNYYFRPNACVDNLELVTTSFEHDHITTTSYIT